MKDIVRHSTLRLFCARIPAKLMLANTQSPEMPVSWIRTCGALLSVPQQQLHRNPTTAGELLRYVANLFLAWRNTRSRVAVFWVLHHPKATKAKFSSVQSFSKIDDCCKIAIVFVVSLRRSHW